MITEIGHFALVLALCVALLQAVLPLYGAARGDALLIAWARPAALAQFLFVAVAFFALMHAYAVSDFSLANVAANSNSTKPLIYKLTGVWSNHEGSMLLWVFILALFGAAVALFGQNLPPALRARVLAVQAMIGVGFLSFILLTSNPFLRLWPVPADGAGLNPILQDPGLAFHPPWLYLGYVGFSISFCFAIAALIEGRVDPAWARWVRPWTLAAWCALTVGIAMVVGLLHLGLGRLVVLGPGRERLLHAMAGRHRLAALRRRRREARGAQDLDHPARDHRVFPEPRRHVPGALRRVDLGARLRLRSDARRLHPAVARHLHRRRAALVRLAGAAAAGRRPVRADFARRRPAAQ